MMRTDMKCKAKNTAVVICLFFSQQARSVGEY